MKINFYLKNARVDYETWIYMTITYDGKRIRVFTPEKIIPVNWNLAKQRARQSSKFPTNPEFNTRLNKIETLVRDIYRKWKNDNGEHKEPATNILSDLIKQALGKGSSSDKILINLKTFWGFFDDFIDRSKKGVRKYKGNNIRPSTIVNYQTLYNSLKAYEGITKKKLDFPIFNIHFYNQYSTYLTNLDFKINSIAKLISNLKLILREAFEDGYTDNNIFAHSKFKSIRDEPETIYLTTQEIEELYNLNLSFQPRLEKVRDAFVIGCFTGMRYSDIASLTSDNVKDGILHITQVKTGNPVSIPLRKTVLDIMAKYNNGFPSVISNQKYNDYIREVCELCPLLKKEIEIIEKKGGKEVKLIKPKFEFVSSHTARRSFATNEFLAKDIKTFQIMAITGHKTEKTFYRYIRLTKEENAEDVAKIWAERAAKEVIIKGQHLKAV